MPTKKLHLPGIEDSIKWENSHSISNNPSRFYFFYTAAFFILLLFLARLFNLTIIAGEENKALSQSNRIRLVESEAKRGKIFDRHGKLLAHSQRVYILEKDENTQEITFDQVQELEEQGLASENFKGDLGQIHSEVRRIYFLSNVGAHVLGYTSVVQKEEWQKDPTASVAQSVGRLGIEQTYNDFLTGKVGKKLIEVDAIGRKVSIMGQVEPTAGRNIHLTIESDLQKVAYLALKKQVDKVGSKKGVVIAQNPNSGEVLALASMPSFNPGDIGKSVTDLEKPFFNRATQGEYPPGSIFKIVSALAGLESNQITKDTEIEDVGEFEVGGSRFSNWYYIQYGQKDGTLKIEKAIARSNDIFFYRLAEKVGLEAIRQMALKLGLGQKTGIDLPAEAIGLVPDEIWKKSAYNQAWFLGDTMHLGIGQGFMLTTPIQMNMVTSFIASGKLTKPYLVTKIESKNGNEINLSSKITGDNLVKVNNLELVRSGMKKACQKDGTAAPFFNANYSVGCKTGTAEKELGNPHAWFTVYAPFEDPKISVTVLIEDGGEGSSVAAPVAKEILDWWIGNRRE